MTDSEEEAYLRGMTAAHLDIVRASLVHLDAFGGPNLEYENARLVAERSELLLVLRDVCDRFGDNDWSNDLHLVDVIHKHLVPHLIPWEDSSDEANQ